MAKYTIEVPPEILEALRNEDEQAAPAVPAVLATSTQAAVDAIPAVLPATGRQIVARVVAEKARPRLRSAHRASERAKLTHTDYTALEAAQQAAGDVADATADAAVESVLDLVK